jgi:hypothetical protein
VRNGLVMAAVLCLTAPESFANSDDLVNDVAAKNRTAVESIQSFFCRYSKTRYDGDGKLKAHFPEVEYWRRGTTFRYRCKRDEHFSDTIVTGLQQQTSTNNPLEKGVVGIVTSYNGLSFQEGDPWFDTMVLFIGDHKKSRMPVLFAELVKAPNVKVSAKRVSDQGKEFAVVELTSLDQSSKMSVWFDPRVNYLISRKILSRNEKGKPFVATTEVERFIEAAPGVYFPANVTHTWRTDGRMNRREVSVIKDVRANHTLPAEIFQLGFQPGTQVLDSTEGKRYKVGPDGHSKVEVEDLAITGPTASLTQRTETKSEPMSITSWLLPLSLLLLATAGGLWLVRRLRAARA